MGHHDHGHHATSHAAPAPPPGDLVRVFPEANPHYYLTAKGDTVVLVKGSDHDHEQQWYKDNSHGSKVKDDGGHASFALINKASGLALKHSSSHHEETVVLAAYKEGSTDSSFLWTQSDDVGGGFHAIRPVTNTHLNLDADHADKEHGGVKDHNKIQLYKWNKGDNQKWKIVAICEFLQLPPAVEDLLHSL